MNGDALFMDALGESIKYYCEWQTMEEGLNAWQGTCGVAWILEDGTPADNGMNYCPRCGRPFASVQAVNAHQRFCAGKEGA